MSTPGEIVREARLGAGISQRSLARRAGTTQAAVSRIERGLEEPGFERFRALMAGLGLKPSIVLEPLAPHRMERRRLLEAQRKSAGERVLDGAAMARLAERLRQGADAA